MPPLRDREGDRDLLLNHFAEVQARNSRRAPIRFDPEAAARLRDHDWPGNVRELRNLVETANLLAKDGVADVDCLPLAFLARRPVEERSMLETDERSRIANAIATTAGNMSIACSLLGISRASPYRRMEQYQLDRSLLKRRDLMPPAGSIN